MNKKKKRYEERVREVDGRKERESERCERARENVCHKAAEERGQIIVSKVEIMRETSPRASEVALTVFPQWRDVNGRGNKLCYGR